MPTGICVSSLWCKFYYISPWFSPTQFSTLRHNEVESWLYCSYLLLHLFSLRSGVGCGRRCTFSLTWSLQRHANLRPRGYTTELFELYDCTDFRWNLGVLFDANAIHTTWHDSWDVLLSLHLSSQQPSFTQTPLDTLKISTMGDGRESFGMRNLPWLSSLVTSDSLETTEWLLSWISSFTWWNQHHTKTIRPSQWPEFPSFKNMDSVYCTMPSVKLWAPSWRDLSTFAKVPRLSGCPLSKRYVSKLRLGL